MKTSVFFETLVIDYFVPVLMILFTSVVVLLFLNRFSITIRDFKNRKNKRKINTFLPEIIYGGYSELKANIEIEKFKRSVPHIKFWFKELLISSMIEFKTNLKGLDGQKFYNIYEAFSLNKHSYSFLKHPINFYKKKGIYQLQMMDYKPAAKQLEHYMFHANQKLSANALLAFIMLSGKDISFLINIDYELSYAKEIEILGICKTRKLRRPKLLRKFLTSENNFIVRVGLHLVVYYNASDLESEITNCIDHQNPVVRKLAYVALGNLFLVEKADDMLAKYNNETKANQTQIIMSLGKIGDQNHLEFLKNRLLESNWNEIEIARTIQSIDSEFLTSLSFNNQRIESLKRHTDEPLLK
ncbi:HEAT repeat domain-containing protein [Psychroflexus aestuariivivens]|uniref:HEAT repeat domain-containing protein n=1 Tax=Psychroflexus aestuariivivens TaxID=1795040 RepID=UPI000FD9483D|nr:hypothetical protein [Psychroflexus aestuariivivens]